MSLVRQSLVQEIDYGTPRSKSEKMVSLSIDGKQISVPEGTSIMRAAMETGIEIPKLCATDMLDAFGSCRLCLVEIEGRGGTPASCTTPVAEGIVVRTKSERLDRLRKGVMELYVSDHPVDSLDRAKHAGFDLLDTAAAVGLEEVRYGFDGARHRNPGVDDSNPYFTFDPAKCIVCSRCVRACEEVQGTFALTISGRGFDFIVAAGMDEKFIESECVSCGACVQACPTGSLIEKTVIEQGKPEWSAITTCAYCGVGCAFKAEMRGEEVVLDGAVQGRQGEPRPLLRQRPFRLGLRQSPRTHPQADDPRNDYRAVARGLVGGSDWSRRLGIQAYPGDMRTRLHWGHYLLALHGRGNFPGAKTRSRDLRQQQCRYLRPRLPLADRLRLEHNIWNVRGYTGLQFGRAYRRNDRSRCQPDRRAPCVRFTHEEAAARGSETDCHRSATDRSRTHAARGSDLSLAAPTRHQRRDSLSAGACHCHRRPSQRGLHSRAL